MRTLVRFMAGGFVPVVMVLVAAVSFSAAQAQAPRDVMETVRVPSALRVLKLPFGDPNFFPLAVWLQDPKNASRYKAAGVNIYVGLWKGPTEKQLAGLRKVGMPVICEFNAVAVKRLKDPLIIGWLQEDEPDICHAHRWEDLRNREKPGTTIGAWRPPTHPDEMIRNYKLIKAIDPVRPVYVGFSLAVVYPDCPARANRRNHPEDFPEYMKGADIVGFDIYPGVHQYKKAAAKYWTVPKGVRNLVEWAKGEKTVWVTIEAMKPRLDHSPHSFKAEVWMSIIYGATGINYYVHQNASGRGPIPFIEASVFEDPEMLKTFTATNKLITSLAPVLNSPTVAGGAKVTSSVPASEEVAAAGLDPIAAAVKTHAGATYLFSVRMENSPATATFQVKGLPKKVRAEVIGEGRTIEITDGRFTDEFKPLEVHIYKIPAAD